MNVLASAPHSSHDLDELDSPVDTTVSNRSPGGSLADSMTAKMVR
jgi:hypothetical protein